MKKILLFAIPILLFFFRASVSEAGYIYNGNEYQYCFENFGNSSYKQLAYFNVADGWYPFLCGSSPSNPSKVFSYKDCQYVILTNGSSIIDPYNSSQFDSKCSGVFIEGSSVSHSIRLESMLHEIYNLSFVANFPVFESHNAAMNYYSTGDTTGSYYIPEPPVPEFDPASDAHDFTKDVYDPNLSVPVLSNVSYTGFSIDNPDGKEWQVVVDGRVFGLKWNPSYTDPMLLTNTNYIVNHQLWNFAEHPVKMSLSGRFDIYDNYGISTYDWFVEQVKQYANDVHPSDYPNYSFLKVGIKTGWNTFLDYIKDIGSDEAVEPDGSGHRFEQNIYRSRMCQVTYYVRFVEYDADGNPHYSRWMAYTLKPSQEVVAEGENFSRGNVEFGEVTDVDPVTGRPVVSDKESLKYNTSTGEYEYYDPLSNQNFQFEMDDVFGYLSGLKESVMGFADLIAYCFSFLPSWVSQFISYSLVVAISFSVIRLIRG